MMAPARTITAPIGTSLRFTASRARSRQLRMYCSSIVGAESPSAGTIRSLTVDKRRLGRLPEGEVSLGVTIHDDMVPLVELSLEYRERQRILEQSLDCSLQWSSPNCRIVTFGGENLTRWRRQFEAQFAISEELFQPLQLQVDDMLDLSLAERAEN